MKTRNLLAVGLCLLAAGARAATLPEHFLHLCEQKFTVESCASGLEAMQSKTAAARQFRRAGKVLTVRLASGVRRLVDAGEEAGSTHYTYLAYMPALQLHVLYVQYYEGEVLMLIDRRSGRTQLVDAMPLFAPDGKRFVTVSFDADAQFNATRIQLFRRAGGGFVREFERASDPVVWGPRSARWTDLRHVRIDGICANDLASPCSALTIANSGGRWKIAP